MDKMKQSIDERLRVIEARNRHVELDKAWEVSWIRRICVGLLTYVVVAGYLVVLGADRPFTGALVPLVGYLLSTLLLKRIRDLWQK